MHTTKHYVFVYGTLMPKIKYTHVMDNGHELASLGAFPTIQNIGNYRSEVYGVMLEIDDEMLKILDKVEGHPGFFQRKAFPSTDFYRLNPKKREVEGKEIWVYMLPKEGYHQYRYKGVLNNATRSEWKGHRKLGKQYNTKDHVCLSMSEQIQMEMPILKVNE